MQRKTRRPAHCEPGSLSDPKELGQRLRLSRERLADSELASIGQAWRLWAACADATFGYAREADQIYVTTLARNAAGLHRNAAARIMRRFDELGVFGWQAAPRGSHGISLLTLPPLHAPPTVHVDAHALPTVHEATRTCTLDGALQTNEVMSVEAMTDAVSLDAGTHRSSLIGASDSLDELGSPESGTPDEGGPARCATPGCDGDAFSDGLCIECDRERFYAEQRFKPWHGDERTGDGVGDDEAAQVRWAGANPSKTRARRQRNGGGHLR